MNDSREKRSSHGLLSALGGGIKLIGQGSASAVAHSSSSGSGYHDYHIEPEVNKTMQYFILVEYITFPAR